LTQRDAVEEAILRPDRAFLIKRFLRFYAFLATALLLIRGVLMSEPRSFPVFDESGQVGRVLTTARFLDDRAEKTVLFNDGTEMRVPANTLEVQKDGSFFLRRNQVPSPAPALIDLEPRRQTVVPISTPEAFSGNGAASPSPQALPLPQVPQEPLFQSGYDIETVNVDRLLDGPVQERYEGDTMILPVVEEVWVVEKRLYLRQEIRITKSQKPVSKAQILDRSRTN
jgi:hypothetical protein